MKLLTNMPDSLSINDKFSDTFRTCYKWKVENSFGDMYNIEVFNQRENGEEYNELFSISLWVDDYFGRKCKCKSIRWHNMRGGYNIIDNLQPILPSPICCKGVQHVSQQANTTTIRRSLSECLETSAKAFQIIPERLKQLSQLCKVQVP
ncbi:hypothetical protein CFP56_043226, partial [Quercus suber]